MAIKLKGHETFTIREGWLDKGLKAVSDNGKVFSENYGADALGVGSNMAKAIRYWLKAGKFIEESPKNGAKLTDIAKIWQQHGIYFLMRRIWMNSLKRKLSILFLEKCKY